MHDTPLDLATIPWTAQKEMVRVFYKEMWDHANTTLVPQLFHPDFTFRGSLGPALVGHEQFIGYVRFVTGALDRYTSDILALGEEGAPGVWQAPFPWSSSRRAVRCSTHRSACVVVRHADLHVRW